LFASGQHCIGNVKDESRASPDAQAFLDWVQTGYMMFSVLLDSGLRTETQ